MSHFRFSTQIISKSNRSAVACSAYRSGSALYSERDGLTKNFKEREVQPDSYILSPKNAPEWTKDRQSLWNEVEKKEKQHNSQLAREIVISLPTQLSNEEQTDLTLDFCKENFSDEGMVADINIHRDKKHNPHAHIMLTIRPFNDDGTWGNKRKKENGKSIHLTDWNKKETMIKWRKDLADRINYKFKEKGIEDYVSHESYAKQGLEKIPKIRLSRDSYQYENRMKDKARQKGQEYQPVTHYGKLNKEIIQINKELSKEQEKVVSLESHKQEKETDHSLASIRKNVSLTDMQKSALTMVAKRSKSYVDYKVASNIYKDISEGNWSKKLDKQKTKILAEKNTLNKAKNAFNNEKKQVIRYGFMPSKFQQQFNDKITAIKGLENEYEKEFKKFQMAEKKAELALELQKRFTEQEFTHLYGESKSYKADEMYAAVEHFKDTGTLIPKHEIKHLEMDQSLTVPLIKQTRNAEKSIFILDRAIKKQSRERVEALKKKNFDKAYIASNKMEEYQLQKKQLSHELEGNKEFLRKDLSQHYNQEDVQHVSSTEALVQLNQLKAEGKSTSDLDKDLKQLAINHKQRQEEHSNKQDKTPNHKVEKAYMNHISDGLFQALEDMQQAKKEKAQKMEPSYKKKRRKHREKGNHLEL
ncbi:MobA/MobL family protein (plasmid) [Virgibacillus necropolis]|uniref:MobQ family relaxase n=1 Tax=Virgibacillus necropolis TaxID=163877 RepID=UPI00384D33FC